jgi:general secretion pathway protein G
MTMRQKGFTIVELLVVIVVIGILAAITVTAYNGVQGRARDAERISDLKNIADALEIYRVNNGAYPTPVSTPNASSWEVNTDGTTATNFLSALSTANIMPKVPVDPTNKGTTLNPSYNNNTYAYFYYVYAAGSNGCDVSRGPFYVLGAMRMDSVAAGQKSPVSPGFSCLPTRDWSTNGAWVTGDFTN